MNGVIEIVEGVLIKREKVFNAKMAGRKSKAEELKIIDRYAALAEPFFEVLQKALNSKSKREQHWAIEQLSKGFVKMIPQKIGGDPDNRTPIPLLYAIRNHDSNTKDIPA